MTPNSIHFNQLPSELYSLPFEAMYPTLGVMIATIITEVDTPKKLDDVAIRVTKGTANDVSFRCQNAEGHALFLLRADELADFVPDWMQLINPGELYQHSEQYLSLTNVDGELCLDHSDKHWDEDSYQEVSSDLTLYRFGQSCEPFVYIMDAGNRKIQPSLSSGSMDAGDDHWEAFCDRLTTTGNFEHALGVLQDQSTTDAKQRSAKEWISTCHALGELNVPPFSTGSFVQLFLD